ncbi:MAG: 4Fe-4S binding protein [Candidatus Hydrogenedentes bacterium]|nr:4Fe-4S binding protein [Candidatus Hydrogenedentota bacterium]
MLENLRVRTIERRVTQVLSLIALHSSWGPEFKWLCNPVLSCHSCVLAWFACPVGVFVHYSGFHTIPFLALGMVLLLGVTVGRLLCGWVCPFGFLQDLLYKIPSPKFHLPAWTAKLKYVVLALTVIALPFVFGEQTWLSFCRVCPASALQVTIPNIIIGGVSTLSVASIVKLAILVVVLVAAVLSSRSFCKVICPIGAILAPLNLLSFWKIKVPTQNCSGCQKCNHACPQDGLPQLRVAQGVSASRTAECVFCYECQTTCPMPLLEAQARAEEGQS